MHGLPLAVLVLVVCGCTEQAAVERPAEQPLSEIEHPFAEADINPAVMGKWSRSCALCHVNGEGGAPVMGDVAAWRARLAQGEDMLLTHTIEGFNNMPPLGYCMACERDDLLALIRLMAGEAG